MYALIQDNQIKVGPREWRYHFFKQYLDFNDLDSAVLPIAEPTDGKVVTADLWKIIPVAPLDVPSYDSTFEQLAGPYWTINQDDITGYYDVVPVSVDAAKNILKQRITDVRYKVETGGCPFTFDDGTEVKLYTTREDRNVYFHAYQIITEHQSITFKFERSIFKSLTKDMLGSIIATGAEHVQATFEWEASKYEEIETCITLDQLKLIDINYPQ